MARGKPEKAEKTTSTHSDSGATTGYEAQLWQMADALRGSMDAAEYKHVVLGLIFLKYISDAFEERCAAILAEWGKDAAEAADTIVGFFYRVHRQDRTPSPSPGPSFDNNGAFNDHVDESFGPVTIFDVQFRPSEVLFQMEPETYRIYLAEFDGSDAKPSALAEEEAQT